MCCSQRGCCLTATQTLLLPACLELQKLDGSCVAGRTEGSLLALPSCSLTGQAHGALCSATGSAGILPEPPLPTGTQSGAIPGSKPHGMSSACRCQTRTTFLCPVYGSVPGCGGISGAHGTEKRVSGVLFSRVSKLGDAQSAGPRVGTSHSSQVPAYKTHPNATSLESNNVIMVPGLCSRCPKPALQSVANVAQAEGLGRGCIT